MTNLWRAAEGAGLRSRHDDGIPTDDQEPRASVRQLHEPVAKVVRDPFDHRLGTQRTCIEARGTRGMACPAKAEAANESLAATIIPSRPNVRALLARRRVRRGPASSERAVPLREGDVAARRHRSSPR